MPGSFFSLSGSMVRVTLSNGSINSGILNSSTRMEFWKRRREEDPVETKGAKVDLAGADPDGAVVKAALSAVANRPIPAAVPDTVLLPASMNAAEAVRDPAVSMAPPSKRSSTKNEASRPPPLLRRSSPPPADAAEDAVAAIIFRSISSGGSSGKSASKSAPKPRSGEVGCGAENVKATSEEREVGWIPTLSLIDAIMASIPPPPASPLPSEGLE